MAVWASHTARKNYKCPKCGANKGVYCKTPKGNPVRSGAGGVHEIRMSLLTEVEWKLSQVKLKSAFEVLSEFANQPQVDKRGI